MSDTSIPIIFFSGLSLLISVLTLWQNLNWRRQDKSEKNTDKNLRELSNSIERISHASNHQYCLLREHMLEYYNVIEGILDKMDIQNQQEINKIIMALKEKSIVRLRKMEISSLSRDMQKEALMFFAGSHYRKNNDVIEYVLFLYNKGHIYKENNGIALRIIGTK